MILKPRARDQKADGIPHHHLFFDDAHHSFAVGVGHRRVMQGWFAQIIVGVIVTVIGTLVTDAITGSHMSRHFSPGYHSSWRNGH